MTVLATYTDDYGSTLSLHDLSDSLVSVTATAYDGPNKETATVRVTVEDFARAFTRVFTEGRTASLARGHDHEANGTLSELWVEKSNLRDSGSVRFNVYRSDGADVLIALSLEQVDAFFQTMFDTLDAI